MKQKLISLLCCLALLGSLVLTAAATDPQAPWVVDNADLLTSEEEAALTARITEIRMDYEMDVVILTVDSLDGKSAGQYADDFYDLNGYGIGDQDSGVLLLLAMETREWYISTCGEARYAVSDYDTYDLFDAMSSELSNGAYYDAFDAYLGELEVYYSNYRSGSDSGYDYSYDYDYDYDYDYGHTDSSAGLESGNYLISIGIGLVVGGIVLLILRGMMNSKRPQRSAADYLQSGSYHLRVQRDSFLYSSVHKTPKPKDNGGSHGGRVGGGGGRHGGGGGRF